MHLLLKIYFLFSTIVFANVVLEDKKVNFQDFEVAYYIDSTKKMDFDAIKNQSFTLGKNKKSFRSNSTNLWIKIKVHNKSAQEQKLFLHHSNAYRLKQIKFYETDDKAILNSLDMNMSDVNDTQHMYGTDAIYKFTLDLNESKVIYIQATSFIYQYYSLMLFDEEHSAKYLASSHLLIIVILSILMGLMLYHFILYLMTFFKDYLYYSLYLFFNILWGSYEYGLMGKYLGWYGKDFFIFDILIILPLISLTFFIKVVLQMPKLYPTENKFANFIIMLLLLSFTYIFIDIYFTLYLIVISMIISGIIYIGIIVSLYLKKDRLIVYVLFAQIWFIFFNFLSLAFYEGFSVYNFFMRYSIILGTLLDTFAFSYLLSHRIRLLQEENKKGKHKTKRLQALSELLENISHQWRQPLTRINASVMHIAIEMKKNKVHNPKIEKKLDDIENLSVYLSQTIDDFKSLYREDREAKEFNLHNAINDAIKLIDDENPKHNIGIEVDVSKNIYLHSYLNELQQVLQVILNNAKDALIEKQIANPNIVIFTEKKEKQIILKISNNGGEIERVVMDQIFNAHFTTKKYGEGIGLFMSQKIVTELIGGTLSCHNIAGGVCFEIKFKIED